LKTILVVDDEFANAETLAMLLEEEGYKVSCAANGGQGLAKVEEIRPDLVLMDFMMPIMNGAEMGRQLRANRNFARVKVIMQSSLPEDMAREQWDGYDAYIRKPFAVDDLLALVKRALE
jgi:CheY-like chemotaxis protein